MEKELIAALKEIKQQADDLEKEAMVAHKHNYKLENILLEEKSRLLKDIYYKLEIKVLGRPI